MNRTGLLIALAIGVVAGLAFGLYPELDLRVAGYFYGFEDLAHNKFAFRFYPPLMKARDIGLWIGTILVAPAVAALVIKLIFPRRKLLMSGRAVVFLMATMILAPLGAMLIQAAISRSREYDADAASAKYVGSPYPLINGLQKLDSWSKRIPMDASPATAHMFIIKPFTGQFLMRLFSTHPSTQDRIARLEQMR